MPCLSSCLTCYLGITATIRISMNLPLEINQLMLLHYLKSEVVYSFLSRIYICLISIKMVFIFPSDLCVNQSKRVEWSSSFNLIFKCTSGCTGSSLLCAGFLSLRGVRVTGGHGARAAHEGASCCRAQTPGVWVQLLRCAGCRVWGLQ